MARHPVGSRQGTPSPPHATQNSTNLGIHKVGDGDDALVAILLSCEELAPLLELLPAQGQVNRRFFQINGDGGRPCRYKKHRQEEEAHRAAMSRHGPRRQQVIAGWSNSHETVAAIPVSFLQLKRAECRDCFSSQAI